MTREKAEELVSQWAGVVVDQLCCSAAEREATWQELEEILEWINPPASAAEVSKKFNIPEPADKQ
jgi:hypothetical protein